MKKEETVGFIIKTLNKSIMRKEMAAIEAAQCETLPPIQGLVIGYLYKNRGKEVYQKDLETTFCIARSTVTNIVKQMEHKGFINRVGVERDCRLKKLELTQKGMETHKIIIETMKQVEESICQGITSEELATFMKVARQMRDNLRKEGACLENCSCVFSSSEKSDHKETDNNTTGKH